MAGRYTTPKWRFPLLVLLIGAIAAVFIAFSWHPVVHGIVLVALALLGLGIMFFPDYLEAAEKHKEEHDQKFRQGRFYRWQKYLKERRSRNRGRSPSGPRRR